MSLRGITTVIHESPRTQGFGDLETSETQRKCQNLEVIWKGDSDM